MTPEQWTEWLAYRQVEPDPWERLLGMVRLAVTAFLQVYGVHVEPRQIDPGYEEPEVDPSEAAKELDRQIREAVEAAHGRREAR